jgi:hypothetical protein
MPLFLIPAAFAADADTEKIQAQPLDVSVQPGELVGHEQVIRQFITLGTNQLLIVPPPNVRSETAAAETLLWSSSEGNCRIEFRIFGPTPEADASKWTQALKKATLESHEKARSIEQISTAVLGRGAEGVQFRESQSGLGERLFRFVWVPCAAGILEFTMNVSANRAAAGVQTLDNLLINLRSNERGKIEIVRRLSKS